MTLEGPLKGILRPPLIGHYRGNFLLNIYVGRDRAFFSIFSSHYERVFYCRRSLEEWSQLGGLLDSF